MRMRRDELPRLSNRSSTLAPSSYATTRPKIQHVQGSVAQEKETEYRARDHEAKCMRLTMIIEPVIVRL